MIFAFISAHCFRAEGFLWLVCAGWGLHGLWDGLSFVSRVFLVRFALVSLPLWGRLGLVFVPDCVCIEPLGSSFISRAFFFASFLPCFFAFLLFCFLAVLLFCFFASLLCFYLLIAFAILYAVLYSFPISYLSLRFQYF